MNKTFASLSAVALLAVCTAAYALYVVNDVGTWPKNWPSELEPLRKQARTLVGPTVEARHFGIPFKSRAQFESAWPYLLKVKTKAAPIFLVRGENLFLGEKRKAGVIVHCPPEGAHKNPQIPEKPIEGVENLRVRWMNTCYLEVVDDGEVVDFSRVKVPKGTTVIDDREKRVQGQ